MRRVSRYVLPILFTAAVMLGAPLARAGNNGTSALDLDACVQIALTNNRNRAISALSVELAEIQYKQALSSYFPDFILNASMVRFDEKPRFAFSAPGLGDLTVDLTDRDIRSASVDMTWPLLAGGRKQAVRKASIGIDISRENARRTDLEILCDVKRLFYGVVLARRIQAVGRDMLAHFETLLRITEAFYTDGSLTVDKSDYLRIKTITAGFRAYVSSLDSNLDLAEAGLTNTLGLGNDREITAAGTDLPFEPLDADPAVLISEAYVFNPDHTAIAAEIDLHTLTVDERKGARLPTVFVGGRLFAMDTDGRDGLMTDSNRDGYSLGLYLRLPLFEGFLTRNRIAAARTGLAAAEQKKLLFKEGLALRIRQTLILIDRHAREILDITEAVQSAEENRILCMKAYDRQVIDLDKVTETLILETYVKIRHVSALYHHIESRAALDTIIGKALDKTEEAS
ncbi:TolC family protein [Desulfatiferula olefinivorans]